MRRLVVAYFQSVRRNHAVEAYFSGKPAELVTVGVIGTVHVHVVFSHFGCYLFSVRRHVVIGTIDRLFAFCKGGCCHTEDGNERKNK